MTFIFLDLVLSDDTVSQTEMPSSMTECPACHPTRSVGWLLSRKENRLVSFQEVFHSSFIHLILSCAPSVNWEVIDVSDTLIETISILLFFLSLTASCAGGHIGLSWSGGEGHTTMTGWNSNRSVPFSDLWSHSRCPFCGRWRWGKQQRLWNLQEQHSKTF